MSKGAPNAPWPIGHKCPNAWQRSKATFWQRYRTKRFNGGRRAPNSHQELATEAFRRAVEYPVRDEDA